MKRKTLSLVLALIMVLSAIPFSFVISFAEEITANPTIQAVDTYCKPGETATVNLVVSDNPGIAGGAITVTYPEGLTLISAENGEVFENASDYTAPNKLTSPCVFTWDMLDGVTVTNGTLLSLTFSVGEETDFYTQYPIILSCRKGDFFNEESGEAGDVNFTLQDGIIEVLDFIPGDVNDDGSVNGKDIRLIRQYNSSGYDITINEAAADVNDDNVINGKDVRIIRRNFAGGYGEVLLPHHPRCAHENMTAIPYKAATCTEPGNIAYWYCSDCGKALVGVHAEKEVTLAETLLPLDSNHHANITEIPYKAPGCTEQGNIAYWTCTGCKKNFANAEATQVISLAETVLSSAGHSYSTDWTSDAEYHWHTANCEHSTEISGKAKHTAVIDEAVAATYETTGLTQGSHCSVCGKVLTAQQETDTIPYDYRSITYKDIKGADNSANPDRYCVQTGLDLQNIELNGYIFKGWYTIAEGGGTLVESIPKGSTKDYVLYAYFVPQKYTITYNLGEANGLMGNEAFADTEYTIESGTITLGTPVLTGLSFVAWLDENGNAVTEISKGTTGNITLTPQWENARNKAVPYVSAADEYTRIDVEENDEFFFIYYLGRIENIVVENTKSPESLYANRGDDLKRTASESDAHTVGTCISKATSNTTSWQKSVTGSASIGVEFGIPIKQVNLGINGSFQVSTSKSHGESDTISNTTATTDSTTFTTESSEEQSMKVGRTGYYRYVNVFGTDVFAVIKYSLRTNSYTVDTWSSKVSDSRMWEYSADSSFTAPECVLPFDFSEKEEAIASAVKEIRAEYASDCGMTDEEFDVFSKTYNGYHWIDSRYDLECIASYDKNVLAKNIAFDKTQWIPIETFYGELCGAGHKITGMKVLESVIINDRIYMSGFIAHNFGTIKDIVFDSVSVIISKHDTTSDFTRLIVGAVVGENAGIIDNVNVINSIITGYFHQADQNGCRVNMTLLVGGIVGANCNVCKNSTVFNSTINGKCYGGVNFSTSTNSYVGGVIGKNCESDAYAENLFSGSNTIGAVVEAGCYLFLEGGGYLYAYAGGIIGWNSNGNYNNLSVETNELTASSITRASYMSSNYGTNLIF